MLNLVQHLLAPRLARDMCVALMDAEEPSKIYSDAPFTFLIYWVERTRNKLFLTVNASVGLATEATRKPADG